MSGFFVRHLTEAWSVGDTALLLDNAEEILSSEHILGGALHDANMVPLVSRQPFDFGVQPGLDSLRSALAVRPDSANFIVRVGLVKRALVHFRPIYALPSPAAHAEATRSRENLLGFLEIDYDLEFARQQRLSIYKINLFLLAFFVVFGTLLGYAFSRQINRPLKRLVEGVQQFRGGNLDYRVEATGAGELSKLGRAFNTMADELQHRTEALQQSELRHRLLFEDAQDGIFVVDGGLRFVEVNDKFCELAGRPVHDLAGLPMSEVFISRRDHDREILALFDRKYFHGEVQMQRLDNRRMIVDLHASPLAGDLYMGIARDITEKRRYEAELRRAAQLRDLLLATMSEGLVVVNMDAQIIMANEAAQQIFDGTLDELKHKNIMHCGWEMLTAEGEYLEYSRNPVIIALRGRALVSDCLLKIRRPASEARPAAEKDLQINAAPLADDRHNLLGAVVTVRDITANRQHEHARALIQEQMQQREKLASLGEMAAGVAHEINNPVTGIINYAQVLIDRGLGDAEDRNLLRSIAEEGNRIADIVRNLLTFGRREKHEHTANRLDDILDASLHLLGKTLKNDGITLIREVPDNLPSLYCRGPQIQQVFINLLTNARDALNEKFRGTHPDKTVRISARVVERDGQKMVRTEFYDNGTGIAPEDRPKIFDPFFTTKGVRNGTGLGLSVTYGIVKDHQGDIFVESVPGEHTTFIVELPVAANGNV
jgi:PAS domain S-box-containing protein